MAPVNLEGPPPYSLLQNSVECLPYLENQPRGTYVKTHIGVSKLMCCHCHKVMGVKITSEIITTGLKDCTCGLSPVPSLLHIKGLWIAYAQNDQGRIRSSTAQDERSICSGPASTFLESVNLPRKCQPLPLFNPVARKCGSSSKYRPLCSAVSGSTSGTGDGSGKVWMCNLKITSVRVLTSLFMG